MAKRKHITKRRRFDWNTCGHRLRVTRLVLGITEQDAADAYGVSLRTYQKYEEGYPQRGSNFTDFASKYDVSIDWLVTGETARVSHGLSKGAKGKLAILPAIGARNRRHAAQQCPALPQPA